MAANLFDILHVEDSMDDRLLLERSAIRNGLTYQYADSLKGLDSFLVENRARCYVLDGKFPGYDRVPTEMAEDAINSIRKHDPNANIILYALIKNPESIAEKHGILNMQKDKHPPIEVIHQVKDTIGYDKNGKY